MDKGARITSGTKVRENMDCSRRTPAVMARHALPTRRCLHSGMEGVCISRRFGLKTADLVLRMLRPTIVGELPAHLPLSVPSKAAPWFTTNMKRDGRGKPGIDRCQCSSRTTAACKRLLMAMQLKRP